MRSKLFKALLFFAFILLILVLNSKSVVNTSEDQQFIEAFSKEWQLPRNSDSIHASFENEVAFIARLQDEVLRTVHHVEVPHHYFGNVKFYFTNRNGECYDRAVLLEKFFAYYNFPFRHLYLFFDEKDRYPSALNFFKRNIPSHALVEVKTKKGWMAIGTNANWIGLTRANEVLNIGQLKEKVGQNSLALKYAATIGTCFWEMKGDRFRYIYGIYSRHGDFFSGSKDTGQASFLPSFHILPDYNLGMLFANF